MTNPKLLGHFIAEIDMDMEDFTTWITRYWIEIIYDTALAFKEYIFFLSLLGVVMKVVHMLVHKPSALSH